jgi:hypothetical protein
MRWRIPLVVVLALFVAVSCDQSLPTATEDPVPESPTFKVLANEWSPFAWEFDICTETLDAEMKCKFLQAYTETPSGNWAYQEKYTCHGTAVGLTTGYKYRWNDTVIVWSESGGPNKAYNDHYIDTWHIIGQGQAPDFHQKVNWTITYNANGELAVEFETFRETCD